MATSRPRHAVARVRRRQPQRARLPDDLVRRRKLGKRVERRQTEGIGPGADDPRWRARLALHRRRRARPGPAVARMAAAEGRRHDRLSARTRPAVRRRGEHRLARVRALRVRRRRRPCPWDARLAHLVCALARRRSRGVPSRRPLRAAGRSGHAVRGGGLARRAGAERRVVPRASHGSRVRRFRPARGFSGIEEFRRCRSSHAER